MSGGPESGARALDQGMGVPARNGGGASVAFGGAFARARSDSLCDTGSGSNMVRGGEELPPSRVRNAPESASPIDPLDPVAPVRDGYYYRSLGRHLAPANRAALPAARIRRRGLLLLLPGPRHGALRSRGQDRHHGLGPGAHALDVVRRFHYGGVARHRTSSVGGEAPGTADAGLGATPVSVAGDGACSQHRGLRLGAALRRSAAPIRCRGRWAPGPPSTPGGWPADPPAAAACSRRSGGSGRRRSPGRS